jgi:hypothetical protein
MERRRFLELCGLGFLAGVSVTVSRCNSSSPSSGGGGGTPGHVATIANNHGHAATVSGAQLDAGGTVTLDIRGTADHTHAVTLTATQLAQIKANTLVTVTSTAGGTDDHVHAVTFNAPGTVPSPAPSPSPSGW